MVHRWFLVYPPSQRKGIRKEETNSKGEHPAEWLVPYSRLWLLWSWIYLWEAWSVGSWWDSLTKWRKKVFANKLVRLKHRCLNWSLSNREEPGATDVLGTNKETPVKYLKGIRVCSSKRMIWSISQLKCVYTNACSMDCKQEDMETTVQLERCDLIAITETWWWISRLERCNLWLQTVHKGQARNERWRISLYVKQWIDSKELSLKTGG